MPEVDDFLQQLAGYREQTVRVLDDFIPRHDSSNHLYRIIRELVTNTGKGLRPALCLATCGAFGGRLEDALNSAAALELMHNAFLVHDDIEDSSEFRHGRPALHVSEGIPISVNVGDAMQALSMRLLRRNVESLGPDLAMRIFDEFDHLLFRSLEGQATELGWVRDNNCEVTSADYLRLVLNKTCWYSFIHPCRMGWLIAQQRPATDPDRFNEFGFLLGAAFQIADDVLNLTADTKYGKEINGDLYEGKRTLMLTHLLENSNFERRCELQSILAKPRDRRLPRDIFRLDSWLRGAGSLEYAQKAAQDLRAAAAKSFENAFREALDNQHLRFLKALIPYVVSRQH
ncbi:MAG: polyprenyl synthetase family protein [Bryobacteraceae bacterium]